MEEVGQIVGHTNGLILTPQFASYLLPAVNMVSINHDANLSLTNLFILLRMALNTFKKTPFSLILPGISTKINKWMFYRSGNTHINWSWNDHTGKLISMVSLGVGNCCCWANSSHSTQNMNKFQLRIISICYNPQNQAVKGYWERERGGNFLAVSDKLIIPSFCAGVNIHTAAEEDCIGCSDGTCCLVVKPILHVSSAIKHSFRHFRL